MRPGKTEVAAGLHCACYFAFRLKVTFRKTLTSPRGTGGICEELLSAHALDVSLKEVEQTLQMKRHAQVFGERCGPHCRTEEAEGCGMGSSSCAVACDIKTARG